MQLNPAQASLVVVADTLFYPPRRNGFAVRYFPLIQELANAHYQVDIIVINRYQETFTDSDIKNIEKICNRVDILDVHGTALGAATRLQGRVSNLFHMLVPFGIPYHLIDNYRSIVYERLSGLLEDRKVYDFGIGVSVGGGNADLLLSLRESVRPRKILCDFVDSAYLLRKRARKGRFPFPGLVKSLANAKTRRWERSLAERCECIYISAEDAKTVAGTKVSIIPNCVVTDGFERASELKLETPNIAFLGNMSYTPNVAACLYLITVLLPAIRRRIPDIHLYVIGRNPAAAIRAHDAEKYIHITGEVDNVWDYVRSAGAFIFPMQTGAGLQNKILEAMYAARPVITSPIGNEGIGARHGRELLVARTVAEYVVAVEQALFHGAQLAENARAFVQANFSSTRMAADFERLLRNGSSPKNSDSSQ